MTRPPVTVTIITLNEENDIGKAIQSVSWAEEVVVVDSESRDRTVEIAKKLGAKVVINPWPGYGQQKNFAQKLASHDWVLNIDADEVVSSPLSQEIQKALLQAKMGQSQAKGFYFPRKTFYLGRWIRYGGWYPNHLVRLAHKGHSHWSEPAVHEELLVEGQIDKLQEPLLHYGFKSIGDQIQTNLRFAKLGSLELAKKGVQARIPRLILKPIGKFIETFLIKRGFLDGLPGFIIAVNAAHSMFLKYAFLHESRIRNLEDL